MPSPIAHATIGYAVFEIAHRSRTSARTAGQRRRCRKLLVTVGLVLLPDVDGILGLLVGNLGRYHNNLTHSLFLAWVVASVAGVVAFLRDRRGGLHWFAIALACYGSHLLADTLTIGRGIMWLWPWSLERLSSPMPLFYGLHWSDGLWSVRHIWTLITELGFVALVIIAVRFVRGWRQRTAAGPDRLSWPEQRR